MLQLNASVHSWLTRQEIELTKQQKSAHVSPSSLLSSVAAANNNSTNNSNSKKKCDQRPSDDAVDDDCNAIKKTLISNDTADAGAAPQYMVDVPSISAKLDSNLVDVELHKRLKNDVCDMYSAWDEADQR